VLVVGADEGGKAAEVICSGVAISAPMPRSLSGAGPAVSPAATAFCNCATMAGGVFAGATMPI
jgi:hypothetical protein